MSNPKFILSLAIKDLTNVPAPSGTCYVKWYIKDRSLTTVKGKTKKVHIRDYRAVWGYSTQLFVKVPARKDMSLRDKELVLQVYTFPPQHNHHSSGHSKSAPHLKSAPHSSRTPAIINDISQVTQDIQPSCNDSSRTRIGRVEINLSEFVNYDEPRLNRYLLKDSKINAVLHVEIGMEALKGDNRDYIAPPVRYKGLSNVFASDTSSFPESAISPSSAHGPKSASQTSTTNRLSKTLAISNDPVIYKLYERTFDHSWDMRPGEYNVAESVEDIFNGGDGWSKNEDGVCLIDLQRQRVKDGIVINKEIETKFGGVNEFELRHEMKSWQVHHFS